MFAKKRNLTVAIVFLGLIALIAAPVSVRAQGDPPPTPLPPANGWADDTFKMSVK